MVLDFRVFERSDLSFTLASQQDRRRKNPFNPKQKGRGAGGRVVRREKMSNLQLCGVLNYPSTCSN